jgi:carboxyl-terminal processing protease
MNASLRITMTLTVLTTVISSAIAQDPHDIDYRNRSRSVSSGTETADIPELPTRLSDLNRSTESDRFRQISRRDPGPLAATPDELRYRVPLEDRIDLNRNFNRFDDRGNMNSPDVLGRDDFRREVPFDRFDDRTPVSRPSDLRDSRGGRDPFIPAPLPESRMDDEAAKIDELITIRYQNPVTVRAIRAISSTQAVSLFAEVSQKIDERSLEPTSYDVRVRRALRNLTIALDNPAFVNGLGLSADSFQLDGFRNTLARLASSSQVSNYSEARTVLTTVMNQASSVKGLTPSVVGFEFANASIDTLDKFSGLEPADPMVRNGAAVEGVRSAALEEEIVGVGVKVREHAEGLVVVKPLRGGPAAEAGIQTGDIVVSINGRELAGMTMGNSVDLMKGPSGSQMTLRIYRETKGERDFVLTRRMVRVWTVNDTRILDGTNVGYFSLSRFSQGSTAEIDQALNTLYSKGMKSLIIDLRGNPGGLLTTCVEVSDRFLACGTIVSTKGRLSTDNMVEQATFSKTWSIPLVVLVDENSASASEIFAAAIQENGRGVVVGTKSYGKGSVQTHFPLSAMSGDLRLTTALFYSPTGRRMAGEGVSPDVEVNDRDGVVNGDEVLDTALRVATSQTLRDMAKASGTCKPANPSASRSSSLSNIADPNHIGTAVR